MERDPRVPGQPALDDRVLVSVVVVEEDVQLLIRMCTRHAFEEVEKLGLATREAMLLANRSHDSFKRTVT